MKRWWNVMSKGFLLVISGPSGVGKGTVCDELLKEVNDVVMSVSATTREMRPGEVDGESYFFVDDEKFEEMVKNAVKIAGTEKVDELIAAGYLTEKAKEAVSNNIGYFTTVFRRVSGMTPTEYSLSVRTNLNE